MSDLSNRFINLISELAIMEANVMGSMDEIMISPELYVEILRDFNKKHNMSLDKSEAMKPAGYITINTGVCSVRIQPRNRLNVTEHLLRFPERVGFVKNDFDIAIDGENDFLKELKDA